MKNGEGPSSAKLAKEDAEGEDSTLCRITFILKFNAKSGDRNLLKQASSNAGSARQEKGGNLFWF